MRKDIENEEDVKLLVDAFYTKVVENSNIQSFFLEVNWEAHKPRMYAFWEYVLLDKPANIHSIYDTHQKLNIAAPDFEEWLMLFKTTLDENFTGKKKDLAWQRAMIIAHTFNSKMNPGTELNLHL